LTLTLASTSKLALTLSQASIFGVPHKSCGLCDIITLIKSQAKAAKSPTATTTIATVILTITTTTTIAAQ